MTEPSRPNRIGTVLLGRGVFLAAYALWAGCVIIAGLYGLRFADHTGNPSVVEILRGQLVSIVLPFWLVAAVILRRLGLVRDHVRWVFLPPTPTLPLKGGGG